MHYTFTIRFHRTTAVRKYGVPRTIRAGERGGLRPFITLISRMNLQGLSAAR